MDIGVIVLPDFPKDTTDRNRTSPFAFTGNKFEFRMLGSAISISGPNVILNTIAAEALCQFADILEKARDYNERNNITGCLLYHNQEFIQILEGEKETVLNLFSKIGQDGRHTDVLLLAEGRKADRVFYQWSMAFHELNKDDVQGIGQGVFVDNFLTFSNLAEKRTFPTILFWSKARQLLEK